MATKANTGGATALPTALLAQAIPMLTRHELADLAERLVDALDFIDGDSDIEANGDELDGTRGEDDFCPQRPVKGFAGCPLADGLEDGDQDYCLASDDRGSSGPNARFPGFIVHKQIESEPDCEAWHQPAHLN